MLNAWQTSTHVLMTSNRLNDYRLSTLGYINASFDWIQQLILSDQSRIRHLVIVALNFASVSLLFNRSRRNRKSHNAGHSESFATGICGSSGVVVRLWAEVTSQKL